MLVLGRETDEQIMIGEPGQRIVLDQPITITVVRTSTDKCRLGFDAPEGVPIHRREVFERMQAGKTAKEAIAETR